MSFLLFIAVRARWTPDASNIDIGNNRTYGSGAPVEGMGAKTASSGAPVVDTGTITQKRIQGSKEHVPAIPQ